VDISLNGRAAIVTGGSKGLGYAIAMRFAASGADVAVCSRGREALDAAVKDIAAQAKGKVIGIQGDVAVPADIKRIYDEAAQKFGKVDIVVNNAGTSRNSKFEDLTDEVWREDLDQKLFAAIRLTRLAWPGLKQRKWGRVINVLNIGAKAPRAGSAPTTISRAAGLALTKVLSHEGAPHNVLVNAMLVGFIESDQHVQRAKKEGIALQDYIDRRTKDIPLRRIGKAEEFANLACFLASDQASYITGVAINVDGGHSPIV
jgi:NAD(P)-dependent dehydrogenase (short-subunit alcohol dehydrogenase family)